MKKGLSEIAVILDRSGSMQTIKSDAIGGFNSFIESQKAVPGEATVTLVKFDHEYECAYVGLDIQKVIPLDDSTYTPRGYTALLDAIGRTINTVGQRLAACPESERPETVIVAILTDGEENHSTEFTKAQVAEMIKHQQEKYNWQFIFLAANQDAFAEASSLNIPTFNAMNFAATGEGVSRAYSKMASLTTHYRTGN